MARVVIRAREWHDLAPQHDAYGLGLVIERDDRRAKCLAVVTGTDLAKLSRTDAPSYDDPFWVALGRLGAERLRDELEGAMRPPNEVFPSWQEADSVGTHERNRYAPFQPGDDLLSFDTLD